jgi:hypothetical protein
MFEKDAEEYADEKCGTIETEEKKFCRLDWQRGAEFGYNKCFEQIRKIVNEHTRLDCIIPELLRLKESE